jgi:hypothetical protein
VLATIPNPVVWDGMFHVKVHCAAAAPARCEGFVDVRVPGKGDASNDYVVTPGRTNTIRVDPPFTIGKRLRSVTVRIEPRDEPAVTVTRRLVRRAAPQPGSTVIPLRHVVRDRRGDGVGPLDLRRFTGYVRRGRLVLTWITWRPFTAAQLDHDTGNMASEIFKAAPHGKPGNYGAGVFYLRGRPVAKGGNSEFYNPQIRVSRPSRSSIRIAVPLSVFGKRPRQLWIVPFARTAGGAGRGHQDEGGFVRFRVPR